MDSNTKFKDILALHWWINVTSIMNRVVIILAGLFFTFASIYPLLDFQNIPKSIFILIVGFICGVFLVILFSIPFIALNLLVNILYKGCLGSKKIIFDKQGITEHSLNKETIIPWSDVTKISHTSKHIFVKIKKLKYLILPKRDFHNEHEFLKCHSELIVLKENYSEI